MLLIRGTNSFRFIRGIKCKIFRITFMIVEMRTISMNHKKQITIRLIHFFLQIREQFTVMQRSQISRLRFKLAHIYKCIRFPVKRTDHRRAQILVRNYNRMKTGFLKGSHNTFLIINHPIIFSTGGRQNDRHTLMSIIGLGNHIGKMNQPIQFLHPRSRFTFIAIQTPFHRTRRLSHHQHINFTFSLRLHVLCRMEGKIG